VSWESERRQTSFIPSMAGRILVASLLGAGLLAACGDGGPTAPPAPSAASTGAAPDGGAPAPTGPPAPSREGSTVARAADDHAVFVADEDHAALHVLALPIVYGAAPVTHPLPGRPAQLLVTAKRVIVTIRDLPEGGGALLVLDDSLAEVGRVALPADAWGLALSPDESFVLVSSAWTNRVSAVELATLKVRFSVEVAREPRGITILPDGSRAYVSHLVGSAVTRIDGLASEAPAVSRIDLPAAPARAPVGKKLPASLGYVALASPEGDRVFFPRHALGALGGQDAWFGTAAVDVLDPADDTALAPTRSYGMPRTVSPALDELTRTIPWLDGAHESTSTGDDAFVQPRAAVYRTRERTLLVASEGTDQVAELDATLLDPTLGPMRSYRTRQHGERFYHLPTDGGAPSGIALSKDQDVAYVHCRSTNDLVVLPLVRGEGLYEAVPPLMVRLAAPDGDESLSLGRRLFYSAANEVTSGGLACAGCHPDGRDDGHVWHETTFAAVEGELASFNVPFTNFVGGLDNATALAERWRTVAPLQIAGDARAPRGIGWARQTPMLAGRVAAKGPYGWHAESEDLPGRIAAGFALHRWTNLEADETRTLTQAGHLAKFLREGLVAPAKAARDLTDDEQRGKAIFESRDAGCAGCHLPAEGYTNHVALPLGREPAPAGFVSEENPEFKTPSLLYVGSTAPYFHDGRFASLEALVDADGMGHTRQLSADDKKALVAFMRTL
jgi:DNA-binding beta-propeller fold protein YncE/mono/diheme cytochrome c family protein